MSDLIDQIRHRATQMLEQVGDTGPPGSAPAAVGEHVADAARIPEEEDGGG